MSAFVDQDDLDDPALYLEAAALGDGGNAYSEIVEADEITDDPGPQPKRIPKVSPYSKRTRALHADGARRIAIREEMHRERQLDGCTFKPQLISKRTYRGGAGLSGGASGERRGVDDLIKFRENAQLKREELRRQEDPECTFRPNIHPPPQHVSATRRSTQQLYEAALKTLRRKDTVAKEQAELNDECTFKPNLHGSGASGSGKKKKTGGRAAAGQSPPVKKKPPTKPIHTRLYDDKAMQRAKLEREQLRQEREVSQCTFSPEILVKVRPSSGGRRGGRNGGESTKSRDATFRRLHENATKREQRMEERRRSTMQDELAACTFSPNLTKKPPRAERSPDMPASTGPPKTSRDFPPASGAFDRLYNNAMQLQAKRDAAEEFVPKDCTFRPKTNKKVPRSLRLTEGGNGQYAGAAGQTDGVDRILDLNEKFDRMYREGTELVEKRRLSIDHKELAKMQIEEAQRAECTFQPNMHAKAQRRSRGSRLDSPNSSGGVRSRGSPRSYLNEQVE